EMGTSRLAQFTGELAETCVKEAVWTFTCIITPLKTEKGRGSPVTPTPLFKHPAVSDVHDRAARRVRPRGTRAMPPGSLRPDPGASPSPRGGRSPAHLRERAGNTRLVGTPRAATEPGAIPRCHAGTPRGSRGARPSRREWT